MERRSKPSDRFSSPAQNSACPRVATREEKVERLRTIPPSEWESICDGCGRCCMVKLQDETTDRIYTTSVACRLFDPESCRCRHYACRFAIVGDCVRLTPESVAEISWLPSSCAYRRIAEGQGLPEWHPLISGTPQSVRDAGISVHGRVDALECEVEEERLPEFIVDWPTDPPSELQVMRDPDSPGSADHTAFSTPTPSLASRGDE